MKIERILVDCLALTGENSEQREARDYCKKRGYTVIGVQALNAKEFQMEAEKKYCATNPEVLE